MNWSIIFGGLKAALPSIKEVAEVFFGNKLERDSASAKNEHDEGVAVREAYSKEWSYGAKDRTKWDVFIDAVNRTPRPLMALGTISLFVWCAIHPSSFSESMKSLQLAPEYLWWLLYMIVSFYMGGRAYEKVRMPSTQPPTQRQPERHGKDMRDSYTNPAIDDWKKRALEAQN